LSICFLHQLVDKIFVLNYILIRGDYETDTNQY